MRSPTPYTSVLVVKVLNTILITCCARSTTFEQLFISQRKNSLAAPCSCAMKPGEGGGSTPPHAVPSARMVAQLFGLFREGRKKPCKNVIESLKLKATTLPTAIRSPGQEQALFQS